MTKKLYPAFCLIALPLFIAGCGSSSKPAVVDTSTTAALSNSSFNFGNNIVGNPSSQTVVTLTNTGKNPLTLSPALTGSSDFSIVAANSCGATLAAGANCTVTVSFTPTAAAAAETATLNLGLSNVPAGTPGAVALTGTSAVLASGQIAGTRNSQVAAYTINAPFEATVTVNFGKDTKYGLHTSPVSTPAGGGPVTVLVAGMLAKTRYHMQATTAFTNGITIVDSDHTFTTGAVPSGFIPTYTVSTTNGLTPQPGIELVNPIVGAPPSLFATDLAGNVIWTYSFPDRQPDSFLLSAKLMPNGHFIMIAAPLTGGITPTPTTSLNVLREIDLAGNIVRELSMADLNARLAAKGFKMFLQAFSHDVTLEPNGHMLTIGSIIRTDIPGIPVIVGDGIVDLDENFNPVWTWSTFDHLDVNRRPMMFPDWTHANAVVYSPDDHNILFSMRHQNWVIKINFNDDAGNGDIIWKLGPQGDFTLKSGNDPDDWNYAQHNPVFFSANTTGNFSLGMMDNGNDRDVTTAAVCAVGLPTCHYTTIPVMQIDETAKTATLTFHQILPPSLFNAFAGDVKPLDNGNIEYDLSGVGSKSEVFEVTSGATPQTVWHMHMDANSYRVFRIPSLYPGVGPQN